MPLFLILAFDILLVILGALAIVVGCLSFHELVFAIISLVVGFSFLGIGILFLTKDLA